MPSFSPSTPGLTSGETSSISSFNTNTTASEAAGSIREDENAVSVGRETSQHSQRHRQHQHQRQRQRQSIDRERVPVTVTSNNSLSGPAASASRASTRAARSTTSISHSSSSWSTAAPSISSAAPSLPATYDANADAEEPEFDGSGNGVPLGIDVEGLNLNANSDAVSHSSSQPDPRIYTCLFHMLDCHESFVDESHWKTHVLSHFRTHPPPHTARCPLCANTKFVDGDPNPLSSPVTKPESDERDDKEREDKRQGKGPEEDRQEDEPELQRASIRRVDSGTDVRDDGPYTGIEHGLGLETTGNSVFISTELDQSHYGNPWARWHESEIEYDGSAWRRLLDHVGAHYRSGQTLAGSRADFELMRYLYGRRIISDAQFKAMQLAPAPSSPAYHASQDGVRASIGSSDEPYCAPYSRRREERMRGQQKGVSVGVV